MSLTRKSQSALEYMMTYGWAILIIVIVAGVLYSMGIFNPSSSASTTITGFSGLGVTQAACVNSVNNQILELYVSNSVGYPVNVTKINVTGSNGIVTSQNVSSILSAGQSGIFYVDGACNKSSSSYSGSATITYTEPGQTFPGPYFSAGKISGVSVSNNPNLVGKFNGVNEYVESSIANIPIGALPRTVAIWIYTTDPTQNRAFFGYGNSNPYSNFYAAVGTACGGNDLWVDAADTCRTLPPNPATGEWIFVAYLYNGTWESEYSGYSGTLSSGSPESFSATTAKTLFYIGNSYNEFNGGFNGSLANAQIYNTALSYAQIKQLYSEGLGGAPISNAGLIGWWPLDGNANDYSGNNNNGVNSGVTFVSP